MASSSMHVKSPRHITTDCLIRPQLNPQLLQMIDSILQGRQNNQIELPPSCMNYEIVRLFTFATYPRQGKPDIRRFAIAGFYYAGYEDEVICYCCNLTESGWTVSDIPTVVHFRRSPKCVFYLRNPEVNFPFFDLMGQERSSDQKQTQLLQSPIRYNSSVFQARGVSSTETPIVSTGSMHRTDDNFSTQKSSVKHRLRRKGFVRSQTLHKRSMSLPSLKDSGGEKIATTQTTLLHHPAFMDTSHVRRLDFNVTPNNPTRKMKHRFDVTAADTEKESRELGAEMYTYMCKICLDSTACVVFIPCTHLACCIPCSYCLDVCPECKQEIETRINVSSG